MLFNSFEFLIFLPIVYIVYWLLKDRLSLQNLFVVGVSYLFYGWWDWRFLILIAFTSLCSWGSGLRIASSKRPKFWLVANIVVNLAVLLTFKYYDFFVASFAALFGFGADRLLLNVILPVGISFYTFQALSYSVDVYRQKIAPTSNWVEFFAYVAFFPQLVAGPIERATNLLPQFQRRRQFSWDDAIDGFRQMLWGYFKKIVIADNCALVDPVWDNLAGTSGSYVALAVVLFTFQIYCDFSGYSDIAIGVAKLFGIRLKNNFLTPYFSRSVSEFWKRWHISLNTWFVDYVYIPLGGSRPDVAPDAPHRKLKVNLIVVRNTLVIFLLSGLWHGANWTYVLWGLFHALLFIPLIVTGRNKRYKEVMSLADLPRILLTFALVVIGWIFFRAPSVDTIALCFERLMCGGWHVVYRFFTLPEMFPLNMAIVAMLVVEWFSRGGQYGLSCVEKIKPRWLRIACYYAVVLSILFMSGENETFIYFQF